MCAANRHVRFTPNSDRESEIPLKAMSALPPKADMYGATRDVRFGPKADINDRVTESSVYALGCAPKSRAVQLSLHRRIVLRRLAAIEHTVIAHNADVTQPATRRQHD